MLLQHSIESICSHLHCLVNAMPLSHATNSKLTCNAMQQEGRAWSCFPTVEPYTFVANNTTDYYTNAEAKTGASTARNDIRKNALDNNNFGFKSSTVKRPKAASKVNMPSPLKNNGTYNDSYVLSGETVIYKKPKKNVKHAMPAPIKYPETPTLPPEPPETYHTTKHISRQQPHIQRIGVCIIHLQYGCHITTQQRRGCAEKHHEHHVEIS